MNQICNAREFNSWMMEDRMWEDLIRRKMRKQGCRHKHTRPNFYETQNCLHCLDCNSMYTGSDINLMEEALREAKTQIEYLHKHFGETQSGLRTINMIWAVLGE